MLTRILNTKGWTSSLVGIAILGVSSMASAMKLGEPLVKSAIGEPLHVQFPILDSTPEELQGLRLKMASADAYLQRKLAVPSYLEGSRLSTVEINGTWYLDLKTDLTVSDSAVDLMFELTWAAGTMLTQQTVLLDLAKEPKVPDIVAAPVVATEYISPLIENTVDNKEKLVDVNDTTPIVEKPEPLQSYTVKAGDSLSKIAKEWYPNKPLEKAILALYSENTNAFERSNMNRLQVGVVLRLPNKTIVDNVDVALAKETIHVQAKEWRAYASRLHGMPNARKPILQEGGMQGSIGSPQKVEDSGDVKVVIKANSQGTSIEKAIVEKNEKEEARSRIAELKKQLAALEALEKKKPSVVTTPVPKKVITPKPVVPTPEAIEDAPLSEGGLITVVGIGGIVLLVGTAGWYVYRRKKPSIQLGVHLDDESDAKEYPVLDNMLSSEDILRHAQDAIEEGLYSKALNLLMSLPDEIRRLEDVQALIRLTSKRET